MWKVAALSAAVFLSGCANNVLPPSDVTKMTSMKDGEYQYQIGTDDVLSVFVLLISTQFIFADTPDWEYIPGDYEFTSWILGSMVLSDGENLAEEVLADHDVGVDANDDGITRKHVSGNILDSLRAGANIFGRALTSGRTINDVENWPERIDAVSPSDVDAAAKAVFRNNRSVTSILLPNTTD